MQLQISSYKHLLGKYILPLLYIVGLIFLVHPSVLHAQIQPGVFDSQTQATGDATGLDGTTDIRIILMTLVQYALGMLGTIFLVLIVFAGYWYIIARGREDYVTKAKITLVRGVVGMIIVLLSYAITTFVKNTIAYVS